MSPFFHNFQTKSPATPSGQEDGTRGNPGKTAESRRAWGSVGRREGQGQGQGQRARAKTRAKGKDKETRTRARDKGMD